MTQNQVRIFTSKDDQAQLEVAIGQETVWVNQTSPLPLTHWTLSFPLAIV